MPDIGFPDTVGSVVIGVAGAVLNGKSDTLSVSVVTEECGQLVSGCRRNAGTDQLSNPASIGLRIFDTNSIMVSLVTPNRICPP